jgi:hypothetical protein
LPRERLEAQRDAVAEALRHATNRYQAGYSSYLEQLDAQRALLNVELSLVQVESDQLNALVAINQAMGGGWMEVTSCPWPPQAECSGLDTACFRLALHCEGGGTIG